MTLQELVTKYTFQVDSSALDKVQDRVSGLVGFVAKLGVAGAAAAGSIFAMAKTTADVGDEAYATSQKLGIATQKLMGLQFAAKQSNIESGALNTGLKFLSKNMDEASKGGNDSAAAFKKLGIAVKDGQGKLLPTDQVLLNLSDKLKDLPNGAAKTALSMKLFGRAGSDMIPLLNEGSAGIQKMMQRADDLGLTMTDLEAKAGDDFNDNLNEMMGAFTGIRNVIGNQLIPVLTPLIKKIADFVVQNKKVIATNLKKFFDVLIAVVKGVYNVFEKLYKVFIVVTDALGGLSNILNIIILLFSSWAMGAIVVALMGIASAFSLAAIQAAIFQAIVFAIPILIATAIGLLLLLLEDIYTFFTDPTAETFTKDLVEGFKSLWTTLSGFFDNMGFWGKAIVNFLLTPFRMVLNSVKGIMELFNILTGKVSVFQGLKNIGAGTLDALKGSGQDGSLGQAFGFGPSSSPATTTTAQNNSVSSQAQIVNNINVGAGADPTQVGKSVQQGTKAGMDESLRGAQRSFSKKGGY